MEEFNIQGKQTSFTSTVLELLDTYLYELPLVPCDAYQNQVLLSHGAAQTVKIHRLFGMSCRSHHLGSCFFLTYRRCQYMWKKQEWSYLAQDRDKLYNICICLKGLRETTNIRQGNWHPSCNSNWAPNKYKHRVQEVLRPVFMKFFVVSFQRLCKFRARTSNQLMTSSFHALLIFTIHQSYYHANVIEQNKHRDAVSR